MSGRRNQSVQFRGDLRTGVEGTMNGTFPVIATEVPRPGWNFYRVLKLGTRFVA